MLNKEWIFARSLFPLSLAWNVLLGRVLKLRNWWDAIDENVIVGALPFTRDIESLSQIGVRGVVNTCEEYTGPIDAYNQHNITQLHVPIIDHCPPSLKDINTAINFIETYVNMQAKVYVHCKAGRGRSATIALCWLMKSQKVTAEQGLNQLINKRSHVNRHIHERESVNEFFKSLNQS